MKKNISKKTICLAMTALILTLGLSVGSAMAYFTTYAEVKGGVQLDLGYSETEIQEKVANGAKQIKIQNTGDYACYIRMIALTGSAYTISYEEPDGAGKWTPGADGYYYYSDVVASGETTGQINVNIAFPDITTDGTEEIPDDFNVIIIQECTPVLYDEAGNPYADWNAEEIEIVQTTYR